MVALVLSARNRKLTSPQTERLRTGVTAFQPLHDPWNCFVFGSMHSFSWLRRSQRMVLLCQAGRTLAEPTNNRRIDNPGFCEVTEVLIFNLNPTSCFVFLEEK
jgi:hypothetical protein